MGNSLEVSAWPGCPTVVDCSMYERAGQRRRRISYHSTEYFTRLPCGAVTLYPSRVCIQVRCSVGIHFSRVPCGTNQTPIARVCVTLVSLESYNRVCWRVDAHVPMCPSVLGVPVAAFFVADGDKTASRNKGRWVEDGAYALQLQYHGLNISFYIFLYSISQPFLWRTTADYAMTRFCLSTIAATVAEDRTNSIGRTS